MKKLIFLLIFLLSLKSYAQTEDSIVIANDLILTALQNKLPEGCKIIIEDSLLIITSPDSVYEFSDKRTNSPLIYMKPATRQDSVIKYGTKKQIKIIYKKEHLWSPIKLEETKHFNELIKLKISELPDKMNMSEVPHKMFRNRYFFKPETAEDSLRVEQYYNAKKGLQQQKKRLPDYHTERYTLFFHSQQGIKAPNVYVSSNKEGNVLKEIIAQTFGK